MNKNGRLHHTTFIACYTIGAVLGATLTDNFLAVFAVTMLIGLPFWYLVVATAYLLTDKITK
jgi:hypothetical protein